MKVVTESQLKGCGWSEQMIAEYLGEPSGIKLKKPNKWGKRKQIRFWECDWHSIKANPEIESQRMENIRKQKEIADNRIQKENEEYEKKYLPIIWIKEYIFHCLKRGDIPDDWFYLFEYAERILSKAKPPTEQFMNEFVEKALIRLNLTNEEFINFVSDKRSGVFAREIAKAALELNLKQIIH